MLSRVGDFYEAYGDDAEDLARSLDIVLTSKEAGKGNRVAMAGVPYHALATYLSRLMRQRRIVAIAEQMEEPVPNRLVRRDIVRVVTPGTVMDEQLLEPGADNHVAAVVTGSAGTAVAAADVSTGAASLTIVSDDDALAMELDRLAPSELLVETAFDQERLRPRLPATTRIAVVDDFYGRLPDGVADVGRLSVGVAAEDRAAAAGALRTLERYLSYLKFDGAAIVRRVRARSVADAMMLDPSTRRHLDVLAGSGDNARASLLAVLDETKTAMGSRLLARRLSAPLIDPAAIRRRLARVAWLCDRPTARAQMQHALARVGDVERLAQKCAAGRANPRDLAALRDGLRALVSVAPLVEREGGEPLRHLAGALAGGGAVAATVAELDAALVASPPATLDDGGVIAPQYDPQLQEVIELRMHAREKLLELEERMRARTGIKSLKIKFTQAYGYYYEVTRAHVDSVPPDLIRRQSLVNAERYTDPELRALEADLLGAKSRQVALERDAFSALIGAVGRRVASLLDAAEAAAKVDVYASLAQVAAERRYVHPDIVEAGVYDVEAGRHPIVETFGGVDFVPNDCRIDDGRRFLLITGPNMGGKSTYLRQTALIAIMAQTGSFVPAKRARLGIVERLFTRIGAGDDIAAGRSTFYVEMAEMALILRRCTPRSLLLIDEIGRGTGTTDGLAIAQAVSEHLLRGGAAMPMVLFATHFHELVRLAGTYPAVENLHVAVVEEPGGPVFSHRVLHGSSSRSYGIAVAQMAGLPCDVVERAREIADDLEQRSVPPPAQGRRAARDDDAPDGQLRLRIS